MGLFTKSMLLFDVVYPMISTPIKYLLVIKTSPAVNTKGVRGCSQASYCLIKVLDDLFHII